MELNTDIEFFTFVRNGAVKFRKTLKKPTKTGDKLLVDFINFLGKERGVSHEFSDKQLKGNYSEAKTKNLL